MVRYYPQFLLTPCLWVSLLILVGCNTPTIGPVAPTVAIPTVGNQAQSTPPQPTSTLPMASSSTMQPTLEGNMDITVTQLQVWQDFMPGVPNGGPPLNATVTIGFNGPPNIALAGKAGTMTLTRANGEEIVTADLELMRTDDDLGLKVRGPQTLPFRMTPQPIGVKLTEGETIKGTARLIVAGLEVSVPLPEAPLMFTH